MTTTELELRAAAIAYLRATVDHVAPDKLAHALRLLAAVKESQNKEAECQPNPKSKP